MSSPGSLDFNPTVIDWLPPPTPELDDDVVWHTVEENKFYYAITSDHSSFDQWQTAVMTTLYDVTESWEPNAIDEINAYKFSAFVLAFQCYTEEENDGCCMASEQDGAMCIFRNDDNEVDTYRFTDSDWRESVLRNS